MEHRNSTSVTSTGSLATSMNGLLGTVSHEFFHSWNVERIRPSSLEPFSFEHANMSSELWLAEGFTNYYGPLVLRRAGITDDATFASAMAGAVNLVLNAPGRRFFSAVEMSQQAPFTDAAVSIDPQNKGNTFISYYPFGEAIALALDLTLRPRGHTLDEFMREMWKTHGAQRNFAPVRPYTVADAQAALARVTGDADDGEGLLRPLRDRARGGGVSRAVAAGGLPPAAGESRQGVAGRRLASATRTARRW